MVDDLMETFVANYDYNQSRVVCFVIDFFSVPSLLLAYLHFDTKRDAPKMIQLTDSLGC